MLRLLREPALLLLVSPSQHDPELVRRAVPRGVAVPPELLPQERRQGQHVLRRVLQVPVLLPVRGGRGRARDERRDRVDAARRRGAARGGRGAGPVAQAGLGDRADRTDLVADILGEEAGRLRPGQAGLLPEPLLPRALVPLHHHGRLRLREPLEQVEPELQTQGRRDARLRARTDPELRPPRDLLRPSRLHLGHAERHRRPRRRAPRQAPRVRAHGRHARRELLDRPLRRGRRHRRLRRGAPRRRRRLARPLSLRRARRVLRRPARALRDPPADALGLPRRPRRLLLRGRRRHSERDDRLALLRLRPDRRHRRRLPLRPQLRGETRLHLRGLPPRPAPLGPRAPVRLLAPRPVLPLEPRPLLSHRRDSRRRRRVRRRQVLLRLRRRRRLRRLARREAQVPRRPLRVSRGARPPLRKRRRRPVLRPERRLLGARALLGVSLVLHGGPRRHRLDGRPLRDAPPRHRPLPPPRLVPEPGRPLVRVRHAQAVVLRRLARLLARVVLPARGRRGPGRLRLDDRRPERGRGGRGALVPGRRRRHGGEPAQDVRARLQGGRRRLVRRGQVRDLLPPRPQRRRQDDHHRLPHRPPPARPPPRDARHRPGPRHPHERRHAPPPRHARRLPPARHPLPPPHPLGARRLLLAPQGQVQGRRPPRRQEPPRRLPPRGPRRPPRLRAQRRPEAQALHLHRPRRQLALHRPRRAHRRDGPRRAPRALDPPALRAPRPRHAPHDAPHGRGRGPRRQDRRHGRRQAQGQRLAPLPQAQLLALQHRRRHRRRRLVPPRGLARRQGRRARPRRARPRQGDRLRHARLDRRRARRHRRPAD
mmetsp:Transcript_8814/g.27897  ORF Transcript_8814/g.27897 Transcript_8814/m.27897 type:complete len:823 (-) Transcript_8814:2636-5104(-)